MAYGASDLIAGFAHAMTTKVSVKSHKVTSSRCLTSDTNPWTKGLIEETSTGNNQ